MIVFGIRICATDTNFSTGTWLKDDQVKQSLSTNGVAPNISNLTCDSGNMVNNAGIILLKHPKYTHQLYFLLSLRCQLPSHTPYFDIGMQWSGEFPFSGEMRQKPSRITYGARYYLLTWTESRQHPYK
jgi:hypothetical protein